MTEEHQSSTATTNQHTFLRGGGEMGHLMRSHDWTRSPLGNPDSWPQSLRTTLSIILNSKFPMFLFWGSASLCFYNDAYRPSLGNDGKHPSALGQPGADVWPEIWPIIKPLIDQVLSGGEATWSEDQLIPIYRNGRLEDVYWTFSYSPVQDESGRPAGVFVTCTETTEKVYTIRKLQLSEERFQHLIREASVGIVVLSGEAMRVEVVNDAYARLIDRRRYELLGQPLFSVVPEAEEVFRPLIESVRTSGEPLFLYAQPYFVYVEGLKKEGFLNLVYQPYREQDGRVTGVMVLCQDVTREHTARRELEESEQFARSIIDSSPVAKVVFVGEDMLIRTVNENMLTMLGRDAAIIGRSFAEVMPELRETSIVARLQHVLATGETYYQPEEKIDLIRHGQPYTGYYNYIYKALQNTAGTRYGVIVTATEVTSLVVARQKVEKVEATLRGAIELAELATWSLDIENGLFTYSERFMHWLGFSENTKDLDGTYNPLPDEYRQSVADAIASAIQPGSSGFYQNEHPIINRLTGQVRIIHAQAQVFYGVDGQPLVLSGTAQDITEQRRIQLALEQQVQQRTEELAATNEELAATNEELASTNEELATTNEELTESNQQLVRSNENLQQFAYIASHDLQEPLRKIQAFGDLLKNRYATELGAGADHLERMQAAASRMSTLIRDLLAFSRISTQQDSTTAVSLNLVITVVLTDLDLRIQETGAAINVAPLPTVPGDQRQLEQLFQNLLSNALKFRRTDQQGELVAPQIWVRTQLVKADELPPAIKPTRLTATYHRIDVTDNGIGFDDKYVDRIFQVFQRLHGKNEYVGTGIGLAICEKVAANHGGAITATSQPGQGATFSVYLPGWVNG